jgi:hypothetical protein
MNVIKTKLPDNSILNEKHNRYDYVDSFKGTLTNYENKLKPIDIGKAFFVSAPKWVHKLLTIRNKIVSIFGLKSSGDFIDIQEELDNFKGDPGENIGLFKVLEKTENEIIMGDDDKHLNFKVSFFIEEPISDNSKKYIILSTTVKFNNWFGKLYFLPVKPIHKFIVPIMLRRIINGLENQNTKKLNKTTNR